MSTIVGSPHSVIKPIDLLLVKLSSASYGTIETVREHAPAGSTVMEFHGRSADAFVVIVHRTNVVIVIYRGTKGFWDLAKDLKTWKRGRARFDGADVHAGFSEGLDEIWPEIWRVIKPRLEKGYAVYVTGHSYGAAQASLSYARIVVAGLHERVQVVTFGQPRVGDRDYGAFIGTGASRMYRNGLDAVTAVPFLHWGFRHVADPVIWWNSDRTPIVNPTWRDVLPDAARRPNPLRLVSDHHPCWDRYVVPLQEWFEGQEQLAAAAD